MHILTLTPFYPIATDNGAGCFVAEPLAKTEQLEVKNSVIVVQPVYYRRAFPCADAPPAKWVRYPMLPGGFGLGSAGRFLYSILLARVRRLHRSHPVDLIHAHSALPCGHAASLLKRELGIPFVVTVHGLDAFFTNQVKGRAGQQCERAAHMVYGAASRVVCISEKVRCETTRCATQPLSAAVIYNGADAQLFRPSDSNAGATILSVGNLIPCKGHELLLRAVGEFCSRWPDLVWEIVGDGPERSRLRHLAGQLGIAHKVRFLGRQSREKVAAAMQRCTIFALPSRYEGLGCVYLEAMSSGKPVIACRGQSIEEVIQHGVNGWLVAPGDVKALSGTLDMLLQSSALRDALGGAARETILRSLTVDHQAQNLAALYRECAA